MVRKFSMIILSWTVGKMVFTLEWVRLPLENPLFPSHCFRTCPSSFYINTVCVCGQDNARTEERKVRMEIEDEKGQAPKKLIMTEFSVIVQY